MLRIWKFLAVLAPLGMASGAAAHGDRQQQPQAQPTEVEDSDLRSYVQAALEVESINRQYLPELEAAETAEDQQSVRQIANQEMIAAIRDNGLSLEEYNAISAATRSQPEVAERVRALVEEMRGR